MRACIGKMARNPESLKNLKPGNKRGPAKVTALLKDDILAAAAAAHPEGRVGYLTQQAQENPGPFLSLLGKLIPTQIGGDPDNPIKTEEVGDGQRKLTAFLESIAVRRGTSGPTDAG